MTKATCAWNTLITRPEPSFDAAGAAAAVGGPLLSLGQLDTAQPIQNCSTLFQSYSSSVFFDYHLVSLLHGAASGPICSRCLVAFDSLFLTRRAHVFLHSRPHLIFHLEWVPFTPVRRDKSSEIKSVQTTWWVFHSMLAGNKKEKIETDD